ncbi:MAG TPA: M28 family metallopeptidase [Candidatus Xenobia bacterium]|jgi:Zn-dependent M28 family amino/carboxypeptidase
MKTRLKLSVCLFATGVALAAGPAFDGQRAYDAAKAQCDIGVRAPGTPGHEQCVKWIEDQFAADKLQVSTQPFDVIVSKETYHLTNVVATIPGQEPDLIVIGAHFDSKTFHDITFVGANDGASGIGVLVELGRVLAAHGPFTKTIQLVAIDGEESIGKEPLGVGLYGSGHYVRTAAKAKDTIDDFILVDMVGDADLHIVDDDTSTQRLHAKVWAKAKELHLSDHFNGVKEDMVDDHTPFLNMHIPSIDLIDFDYGPHNSYWHTAQDTMDKISADSLGVVGKVVVGVVEDLAR